MHMDFIQIRRRLHQIPEPGFAEQRTQALLLEVIRSLPQEHLEVKTWRTGVLVRVRGRSPRRTLAYRADMDGLPVVEETGHSFRSQHEGYMHACGHDVHMTIALGVLAAAAAEPLADDLLVVFQPAEEGPGGARPMLESAEFRAWRPDEIVALHVAPEYPVGTIATRPGILFANTSELFIDLHGTGGHAAFPHRANDMVVAACHLVTQLQTIVARNVNPLDAAVITVGCIHGGSKQNIIADHARLEGTIRTLSAETMKVVKSRIEACVRGIEQSFNCHADIDYGANYRQVDNDARLTRAFLDWAAQSQLVQTVECDAAMTGEDFGYFLEEIPGFLFWLGVDSPYGLHHARMDPSEDAIAVGIRVVSEYLRHRAGQP
ncbi:N-acetyldiaminopimelate deacetylase [Alicyclobacillus shizuokensis]|uniref:N-acetyldiaminopimelate deacetylase n=1 Tax=Alicyclobacillus shizuokensis TaxID=392014 RepID=UPI00082CE332